jgi:hypothetical protein
LTWRIAMSEVKKCAHPTCSCTVAEGEKYCSEICADSTGVTALGCDCKHPACAGELV